MKTVVSLSLAAFCAVLVRAQSPADLAGPAPVSVSSANYRETPLNTLERMVHRKNALNPEPRPLAPLATPKYFVFMRGEIYPSDLTYDAVCALLTPALAKKNYLNAADPNGIIREPKKITLILRVTYGVRPWRVPVVRTEHISWREGLVGKPHSARSLTNFGGDVAWDSRAGGNDDALDAAARNAADPNTPWSPTDGANLTEYEGTRDFNLIVVDAFDYLELKAQHEAAQTLWTTFVAAPAQGKQKFSDALALMLRTAAPFWGETTVGLQVYQDARASVRIGDLVEVKDPPPEQK